MKGNAIIVEIRELRNLGLTKTAVAKMLVMDRGTVSKYWEGLIDDVSPPRYKERTLKVAPYEEYIIERLCVQLLRLAHRTDENTPHACETLKTNI